MKTETIAEYDFNSDDAFDAMGLGDFISQPFADKTIADDELTVYVSDDQGNAAAFARFVRETLTDGSTVVNLVISFDRT